MKLIFFIIIVIYIVYNYNIDEDLKDHEDDSFMKFKETNPHNSGEHKNIKK